MFLVVHSNAQNGTSSVLVDSPPCLFIQIIILTFCTDRVGPLVHLFREMTQKNVKSLVGTTEEQIFLLSLCLQEAQGLKELYV